MKFARYDPQMGKIEVQNMPPNEFDEDCVFLILEEEVHPNNLYYYDGEIRICPEKPGVDKFWEFNPESGEWEDNRTEDQVDQERLDRLENARLSAHLPKLQFMFKVVQAGLISQQSGLDLLDGQLPTELSGLTDTLSDWEKFEIRAKIKGAIQFDRLDPFIITAGQYLGMTPEQIDQLYEITI